MLLRSQGPIPSSFLSRYREQGFPRPMKKKNSVFFLSDNDPFLAGADEQGKQSIKWVFLRCSCPWDLRWHKNEDLRASMATHSSVLAWRIPGMVEPGRLPSMGSHRVGHDWSNLAAAAAWQTQKQETPSVSSANLFTQMLTPPHSSSS